MRSNNKNFKQEEKPQNHRKMGGMMHPGAGGGEKAKNFKKAIFDLAKHLKPYRIQIYIVIVFAILSSTFNILGPRRLGDITNEIVDGFIEKRVYDSFIENIPEGIIIPEGTTGEDFFKKAPPEMLTQVPEDQLEKIKDMDMSKRPEIDFDKIGEMALTLLGLYVLSALFSYSLNWIMSGVTQKVVYNLRKEIAAKINRLPLKYYDNHKIGNILSRITNDVETISQSLNQSLSQIITSLTTIIGIIIMMLTISWQMTLIVFIALPLSLGIISFVMKKSQKYFLTQQEQLGKINGHIEEMYTGHEIIKVFNAEKRSLSKFNKYNKNLYKSAFKSQFYSSIMYPIMSFIGNLDYVGVAVTGGYLAIKGVVNIGDIQAFIQYVNSFNQPIIQTANIANVLQSTAAASERVFEFLDEKEEIKDTKEPIKLSSIKGEVTFENVFFSYDQDKPIINNFNAHIKHGQQVAIVGPTGAGKTTIVNLLMRFYDVKKGLIKIDGVNIQKMKRSDLRKMIGMVLQDTWLFNGSIRDNIAYSKLDATQEEIKKAAKATNVDHIVKTLPNGYNMIVNEEAENISKGEKQLLTIARVMLADSPILILDEATSSVDTRTEVLIQKAMDKLTHGRTSFIIAHRLSTIKNADLILVMKQGSIVEQGNHHELLKMKGFYAKLYNSQFSED